MQRTTNPFQLLKLPTTAIKKVLLCMEASDYLNMSVTSSTLATFMTRAQKYTVHSFQLFFQPKTISLQIKFFQENGGHGDMYWNGDSSYWMQWLKEHQYDHNPDDVNLNYPFLTAFAHVQSLFNGKIRIFINPECPLHLLDHPCFANVHQLALMRPASYSPKPRFTVEELLFIDNNIRANYELSIDDVIGSSRLEQMFTVKKLTLRQSRMLVPEDLLKMQWETAIIELHRFNIANIESMALGWLNQKETPTVKHIRFTWTSTEPVFFNTLKTRAWNRSQRSKHCLVKNVVQEGVYDCSEGFDFERPDGQLATIAFIQNNYRPVLIFHVWHDRFPTKPEIERLRCEYVELNKEIIEFNRKYGTGHPGETQLTNPDLSDSEFTRLLRHTFVMKIARMNRPADVHKWKKFYDDKVIPLRAKIASYL